MARLSSNRGNATPPPLPSIVGPAPAIQIFQVNQLPPIRYWFRNESGTHLIQLQNDRLVHNWRRIKPDDPYPHYADLKPRFEALFTEFSAELGDDPWPNGEFMVEVTYLNPVEIGDGASQVARLSQLIAPWHEDFSDSFLDTPTRTALSMQYELTEEQELVDGILNITVNEARRDRDAHDVLLLQVNCRGKVSSTATLSSALDVAHEWVIRSFKSVTTSEMHRAWREPEV